MGHDRSPSNYRAASPEASLGSVQSDHDISMTSLEEEEICWICLGPSTSGSVLGPMPCNCPRFAHDKCIARWQLQSAGTRKETNCEFCDATLPDWRQAFKPVTTAKVAAVMNVTFHGITHGFEVKPGQDGYRRFTSEIQRVFHLPAESDLSITYTCDEPMDSGAQLTLQGEGAYDAAVHCASLSAARRVAMGGKGLAGSGSRIMARWTGHLGSIKKKLSSALVDLRPLRSFSL